MKHAAQKFNASLGWGLALFVGLSFVGTVRAQTCIDPPAGMIAWWPGDGNAKDILGGRDGVNVGDVQFAPGKVEKAFNFNSLNYISVPDDPIWTLGGHDFTIDLWVNFNSIRFRSPRLFP